MQRRSFLKQLAASIALATGGLAIGSQAGGTAGATLMAVRGIAVAHPKHPLHQLGRPLTERDLKRHRRIFIRDTGTQRQREVQGVELRWTVSNKATSIRAVSMGLGFAWLPEDWIGDELRDGVLKPLRLKSGAERRGDRQRRGTVHEGDRLALAAYRPVRNLAPGDRRRRFDFHRRRRSRGAPHQE